MNSLHADETSSLEGPCDGLIITDPVLISVRGRTITVGPTRLGRWWTEHLPTGQWEPETLHVLERYVAAETCYLDVGAFNGATLLFAAQSARLAIGLEPDPVAFAELQRHVALNPGAGDVRIFCAAAAPADGRARFGNKTMWGKSSSSLLQATGGVNKPMGLTATCQLRAMCGERSREPTPLNAEGRRQSGCAPRQRTPWPPSPPTSAVPPRLPPC